VPPGFTATDASVAVVTVMMTGAEVTPSKVALMALEPALRLVACPCNPLLLLMATTAEEAELQVTESVRICVVLSEYVPVAVKVCCNPTGRLVLAGVMAIDIKVAGVTVSVTLGAVTFVRLALIVVVPTVSAVARPLVVVLKPATAGTDDAQITAVVSS
jgi:hypothetical protein